eukprot:TRINITY_DN23224_c0_g1_i1.p1 TRINITY_DN23224_c0_g1~~TRINITY_DN23224_c0_g1_i1.p1  ORF type:complete len:268 (+),score=58.86 TRINITY_DN23224_c0_g1_i1:150-953(+)
MSRTVGDHRPDVNLCAECSQEFPGDAVVCSACFAQQAHARARSERLLKDTADNLLAVRTSLQQERAKTQRLEKVKRAFQVMLEDAIQADVTIYTGGEETRCHRAILASRSPVFRAMFEHELKEKTSASIRVDDISTPAMRGLLGFLYTGEHDPTILSDHGLAMLAAAHKYDVPDLKLACEIAVAASLGADVGAASAVETLLLARMYDAQRVKRACLDCIARNLQQFAFTEEFRSLVMSRDDPELLLELFQASAQVQMGGERGGGDAP